MTLIHFMTVSLIAAVGGFSASEMKAARATDACMRMDLELTWLIEEHSERGDVRPALLAQAAFDRQEGRKECEADHEDAALMLYERARESIFSRHKPEQSMSHMYASD
jgi:hypothetical protein